MINKQRTTVTTHFHGNCDPAIEHHSEGDKPFRLVTLGGKNGITELRTYLTFSQTKALWHLVDDAIQHHNSLQALAKEENDGRKEKE